jgi:hypothetical protein
MPVGSRSITPPLRNSNASKRRWELCSSLSGEGGGADDYGGSVTFSEVEVEAVLDAIGRLEGPDLNGCTNADLVEMTDLDATVVAGALEFLWKSNQIEAVGPLLGGPIWPSLSGILRVLPGRTRQWGRDGYYQPRARSGSAASHRPSQHWQGTDSGPDQ